MSSSKTCAPPRRCSRADTNMSDTPITVRELIAHLQTLPQDCFVLETMHSDTVAVTAGGIKYMTPQRVIARTGYFEQPGRKFDGQQWTEYTDEEICEEYQTSADKILSAIVL